jgi:hypothetical protein
MPRDFFEPTPEEQRVVLVNVANIQEAERLIESCCFIADEEDHSACSF